MAQTSRADVILGALSLTFVLELDEMIIAGISSFLGWGDDAAPMGYKLEWSLKSKPGDGAFLREQATNLLGLPKKQTSERGGALRAILGCISGLLEACGCLTVVRRLPLLYPLVLGYFAVFEKVPIPYRMHAEECSLASGPDMTYVEITEAVFCNGAANLLGLTSFGATGSGVCIWDADSGTLALRRPNKMMEEQARELQHLCQPLYTSLPIPALPMFFFSSEYRADDKPLQICQKNHMADVTEPAECAAAMKMLGFVAFDITDEPNITDESAMWASCLGMRRPPKSIPFTDILGFCRDMIDFSRHTFEGDVMLPTAICKMPSVEEDL